MAARFGVNLAMPDRQVVALQGDGGFLFNHSETLWSIARYEAPMLIVIMNNHTYNESRARNMLNGWHVLRGGEGFQRYLGDPNVEYTKIAEAYGLKGEKVTRAAELGRAAALPAQHARRQGGGAGRGRRGRWRAHQSAHLVSEALDRRNP
jgi:thiamine pyrophosphate-dependent acetolactate synthase large subunit-like protein